MTTFKKLYAKEDYVENNDYVDIAEDELLDFSSEVEEYNDNLDLSIEHFKSMVNNFSIVTDIYDSIKTKELASTEYLISIENYSVVLHNIANNLGTSIRIPSMEDFRDPYAINASHEIAIEGFYEFIKKIWEKIKEVFRAFFKKVNIFFRRLVNAELDLETYEKYLKDMISKIKNSKVTTTSDNTVSIDTKLPSLLANQGQESINTDFLLNNGINKIKRLIDITNTIFKNYLNVNFKKELIELRNKINDLLSIDSDISKIEESIESIKKEALAILSKIFNNEINNIHDLPDKVYNAVSYYTGDNKVEDYYIFSLVSDKSVFDSLPKNFNIYFITDNTNSLFLTASTEINTYVRNNMKPITMASNLTSLYEFYNKFKSEINIKQLNSVIDNVDNVLNDIINIMKTKYYSKLEQLNISKNVNNFSNYTNLTVKNSLGLIASIYYKEHSKGEEYADIFYRKIADELYNSSALIYKGPNIKEQYEHINNNFTDILSDVLKKGKYTDESKNKFEKLINYINENTYTIIFTDTIKKVIDEYNKNITTQLITEEHIEKYTRLQKFLLNYLTSLQVLLKEISTNLAGTTTELRIELIKYMYQSARLFSTL